MELSFLGRLLICRRRKQTLIILIIVVVIFCFVQILSHTRLNIFQENQKKVLVVHSVRKTSTQQENVSVYDKWRHMKLPSGVHADDAQFYAPNKDNTFSCIHTRTVISMDQVNDDYCDCEDSTDEPGTSACPASRFYCKYQLPHEDPQFLPGSQVNDGICDCCDGSDEWQGRRVPENMRLSDHVQQKTSYQAPCENRCQQVLLNLNEEDKIRHQGNKIRKIYLDAAKHLSPNKKQRYGPEGAFYQLVNQCFPYHTAEYQFTVCPFTSVKQQKPPQPAVNLGHKASWEKQKAGDYVLLMKDEDAKLCPLGHARKTKIHFYCGLEDKVIQVTESERCSYSVQFSSPAACS